MKNFYAVYYDFHTNKQVNDEKKCTWLTTFVIPNISTHEIASTWFAIQHELRMLMINECYTHRAILN